MQNVSVLGTGRAVLGIVAQSLLEGSTHTWHACHTSRQTLCRTLRTLLDWDRHLHSPAWRPTLHPHCPIHRTHLRRPWPTRAGGAWHCARGTLCGSAPGAQRSMVVAPRSTPTPMGSGRWAPTTVLYCTRITGAREVGIGMRNRDAVPSSSPGRTVAVPFALWCGMPSLARLIIQHLTSRGFAPQWYSFQGGSWR